MAECVCEWEATGEINTLRCKHCRRQLIVYDGLAGMCNARDELQQQLAAAQERAEKAEKERDIAREDEATVQRYRELAESELFKARQQLAAAQAHAAQLEASNVALHDILDRYCAKCSGRAPAPVDCPSCILGERDHDPGAALLADAREVTAALKLVEPPTIEPWEHDDDEIYIDNSHHLPTWKLKRIQAAIRITKARGWDKPETQP